MRVQFDLLQLKRAVINLMSNASDAMVGKGNDPRKFAVRDPVMIITTGQHGDFVELTIADNGPGIVPELKSKIREPLFSYQKLWHGPWNIHRRNRLSFGMVARLKLPQRMGKGTSFHDSHPIKKNPDGLAA